jgi:TRAP transporter TAXI family solute receptor
MPRSPRRGARRRKGGPQPGPLERGIELLHAFIDGQEEWGVRELAAATGEPSSTTHRLLMRMRDMGLLEFDDERRRYRAGFELYRIAAVLGQRDRVRQTALPVLDELAASLKEDVWLATHDAARGRIAYVAERAAPATLRFPLPLGHEERVWSEPAGWAILAQLDDAEVDAVLAGSPLDATARRALHERLAEARREGFSAGPSALAADVMLVAAAIVDAAGRPCASLCAVVPRHRFTTDHERRCGIALRDAAQRVSRLLGATLLGGAGAGSWHDAVSVIAGLLQRKSPNVAMVPARGGGQQNLDDLQQGRAAYCLTTTVSLADAFHGRDGFTMRHDRLRAVMNLGALHVHVFGRRGIRLKSMKDLAGLRVSPGAEGFSSVQLFHALLGTTGLDAAAMRKRGGDILHFDYREGARQLLAGAVDVLFWLTSVDNAVCLELLASDEVELLQLPTAALSKLAADGSGYRPVEMAAAGRPAVLTLEVPTALVTTADRPDEEVYRVARVVYENRHELAFRSSLGAADAVIGPYAGDVTSHPGAVRFWEEVHAAGALAVEPA